jgi:hypothetical protein
MKSAKLVFLGALAVLWTMGATPDTASGQTRRGGVRSASSPSRGARPALGGNYLTGTNVGGRMGLFYLDTAEVPALGQAGVTGHLLFGSGDLFDRVELPVAFNMGLVENLEVSASLPYVSLDLDLPPNAQADDTVSGLGNLTLGGKYRIPGDPGSYPDFGVGVDLAVGPLSDDLGDDGVDVTFKGLATHTFPNKLLLTGGLGLMRVDGRGGDSDTVAQLNGGVGLPFTDALTALVELGINQFGDDNGILSLGLRGGRQIRYQASIGLGLGDDAADTTLGVGVNYGFGG